MLEKQAAVGRRSLSVAKTLALGAAMSWSARKKADGPTVGNRVLEAKLPDFFTSSSK
jgi:hypothetical protein